MVKENENKFDDLIAYRKIGFGKISAVDYNFAIDKDYNARVELNFDRGPLENSRTIGKAKLYDEEIELVDNFITKFASKKKKEVSLVSDDISKYEKEEIYYDNIIIEDDSELNRIFKSLTELLQGAHEEISSETVSKTYNEMSYNTIISKGF